MTDTERLDARIEEMERQLTEWQARLDEMYGMLRELKALKARRAERLLHLEAWRQGWTPSSLDSDTRH